MRLTLALLIVPCLALPASDMPELHRTAFVMDGHIHVMTRELLEKLDIGRRRSDGHFDLVRAREGGLKAMFFSVYTPETYNAGHFEVKNTFRVVELALDQIEAHRDAIELALSASDIERINSRGRMAAFLDLEGGFDMEGDLHLLRSLHRLGLRSLQLTAHNRTNAFADSCCDQSRWGGINEHGREVIGEMNRLGMVINVAHASDDTILQVVQASKAPVIYSHGGFRHFVDIPRCISDRAAQAIASGGGVIGIQFGASFNYPKFAAWSGMLPARPRPVGRSAAVPEPVPCPPVIGDIDREVTKGLPMVDRQIVPDEYRMKTDDLTRVIDYGVRLVGEDHVALGSDFDGGPPLPREILDVSDYPEMTKALQRLGYSESRIRKILGLNWLRVIREVTGR